MEIFSVLIAAVWLASGLGAKFFRLAPRHEAIVARFFGTAAPALTRLIGLGEAAIGVWILCGAARPACFAVQAVLIVIMNSLEYWKARDLLLFPRLMPVANAGLLIGAYVWSRGGAS